ncbi:MAG: glucose 1-dehydrogenase [Actinobacteria bacterium]|nr:MAG: glucose 1-dehydrogenase [Actinomycetota bacterium]RIK06051.1 MAG: short chain dehydrogenase [Acidobacteriota bacterium]
MTPGAARSFEGKVAVVTGGAAGIGLATCRRLATAGASVVIADIDDEAGRAVADELGDQPGGVSFHRADVSAETDVAELFAHIRGDHGRLDIAINNAGTPGTFGPIAELSYDDWKRTLDVNLGGVFLCMKAEIPLILESGGGSIVNLSSGAGTRGFALLPAYVASKHGVIGLTRSAALEHATNGLRINAVCPGMIRTAMLEEFSGSEDALDRMGRAAPMGRLGVPDEIAEAVTWLCSESASYVTGLALAVDGGVVAG